MTDETQPASQRVTTLRVQCLSGMFYDVATPLSFDAYVKCVKADGQMVLPPSPNVGVIVVPYHAIGEFRDTTAILAQAAALAAAPTGGNA